MLVIWTFFLGGITYESLHKVFYLFIRNFGQTLLIYILTLTPARLLPPGSSADPGSESGNVAAIVVACPMKLVLICHPNFSCSQSMPRFAGMLKAAYEARGHSVEVWAPSAKVYNWVPSGRLSKWAGYVDQYLLFPMTMRSAVTRRPKDTFVRVLRPALGPWVPVVPGPTACRARSRSAGAAFGAGEIPENPTSITGRIYQRYIRRGFQKARHFVSISRKTQADLHRVGGVSAITSEVVYNGLNFPFSRLAHGECEKILSGAGLPMPASGMLLHVGGAQWYKNLPGVIHLYAHYAAEVDAPLPLWCVSPKPNPAVVRALRTVPAVGRFFSSIIWRVASCRRRTRWPTPSYSPVSPKASGGP